MHQPVLHYLALYQTKVKTKKKKFEKQTKHKYFCNQKSGHSNVAKICSIPKVQSKSKKISF